MNCRRREIKFDPCVSTIQLLKDISHLCLHASHCSTVKLPDGIASGSPGAFEVSRVFPHSLLAAGETSVRKSDSKLESHQSSEKIDKETTSAMD